MKPLPLLLALLPTLLVAGAEEEDTPWDDAPDSDPVLEHTHDSASFFERKWYWFVIALSLALLVCVLVAYTRVRQVTSNGAITFRQYTLRSTTLAEEFPVSFSSPEAAKPKTVSPASPPVDGSTEMYTIHLDKAE